MPEIHKTAIVHPGAVLHDTVKIGAYATVEEHVVIGEYTEVGTHAIVAGHTTLGKHNRIFPLAAIGLECQDLKYKGEPTKLIIGDNNTFREYCTVHPSANLEEPTIVGNNNLIMAYAHIAHNCVIGNNIVIANASQLAGHVRVDDYATIGGLTAIQQFLHVGTHAFMGGASSTRKDIPPYTRGGGCDRFNVAGINTVGLSRRGFSKEAIEAIIQIYKIFYKKGMNVSQAIEYADNMGDLTPEQKVFVDFCRASKNGICK